MPYVSYKGALLSLEEYEKIKYDLEREEMEYIKLLFGGTGGQGDLKEENKESKEHKDKEEDWEDGLQAKYSEVSNGTKEVEAGGVGPSKDSEVSERVQESESKAPRRRRSR